MVKKSVFKEGSGSRKGFVSEFQDELVPKDTSSNNISKVKNKLINKNITTYNLQKIYKENMKQLLISKSKLNILNQISLKLT